VRDDERTYGPILNAAEATGTPLDSPITGLPPSVFRDGEVMTFQYRTHPAAIARLLPEPLQPVNDVVQVQISRWGDCPGIGKNLHECNVMVSARFEGSGGTIVASYSPYFWVESDRAMAGGREFHGQPKRIADVQLRCAGDMHVGQVFHHGICIFTGTMQYKTKPSEFFRVRELVDPVSNINLKILNHIDLRPAIKQLTIRDLTDIQVSDCYEGQCTAEIHPAATAPLYRLPVVSFLNGFYWRTEFRLVGGRILHDYLSDS
jgi:acetoacetate decarboxylase